MIAVVKRATLLLGSMALLAACGDTSGSSLTPTPTPTPLPPGTLRSMPASWSMGAIKATFDIATRSTRYEVSFGGTPIVIGDHWQASVTLTLQLIDPAGATDPTTPGSRAGVDTSCNNAGVGTTNPLTVPVVPGVSHVYKLLDWTHPDPELSVPPGRYKCDHRLQGPHGHQGLITFTVREGDTVECSESYKGTHTGSGFDPDQQPVGSPACKVPGIAPPTIPAA